MTRGSSFADELLELKRRIEECTAKEPMHRELVSKYNDALYVEMIRMRRPLPPECEIDDEYMLEEYIDFRAEYNKEGPYTFSQFFTDMDIVALARVKSVKKDGHCVILQPVEIFKGTLSESDRVEVPETWLPQPWFVKGETCLVFLLRIDEKTCLAPGFTNRMPLIIEKDIIVCYECCREFWEDIDAKIESNMIYIHRQELLDILREVPQ